MKEVADLCSWAVSIGFDALLLSPAFSLFTQASDTLRVLVDHGHEAGARVILRLPDRLCAGLGASESDDEARRAAARFLVRGAVEAGADGVDLRVHADDLHGPFTQARIAPQRFSELVRLVEAEALGDVALIVTAHIEGACTDALRSHLEEEWFHHLHWDALQSVPFDSKTLAGMLCESLDVHDRLGAVTAWSVPLPRQESTEEIARFLHALSLPGVVYVCPSFSSSGSVAGGGGETLRGSVALSGNYSESAFGCSELTILKRALEIREFGKLATASLGIVEGLAWSHEGVCVHVNGPIMVVVNTSASSVAVPHTASLLVSSTPVQIRADGWTLVPSRACAWFQAPRVRPVAPHFWD